MGGWGLQGQGEWGQKVDTEQISAEASSVWWYGGAGGRKMGVKSVQNSWSPGIVYSLRPPNCKRNFLFESPGFPRLGGLASSTFKGTSSSPWPGGLIFGTVPSLLSYQMKPLLCSFFFFTMFFDVDCLFLEKNFQIFKKNPMFLKPVLLSFLFIYSTAVPCRCGMWDLVP